MCSQSCVLAHSKNVWLFNLKSDTETNFILNRCSENHKQKKLHHQTCDLVVTGRWVSSQPPSSWANYCSNRRWLSHTFRHQQLTGSNMWRDNNNFGKISQFVSECSDSESKLFVFKLSLHLFLSAGNTTGKIVGMEVGCVWVQLYVSLFWVYLRCHENSPL